MSSVTTAMCLLYCANLGWFPSTLKDVKLYYSSYAVAVAVAESCLRHETFCLIRLIPPMPL